MKNTLSLLAFGGILALASCASGPTPEEIAAKEQARLDSIAAVEQFRADSAAAAAVEQARLDSIAAVEQFRADSIAAAEAAPKGKKK